MNRAGQPPKIGLKAEPKEVQRGANRKRCGHEILEHNRHQVLFTFLLASHIGQCSDPTSVMSSTGRSISPITVICTCVAIAYLRPLEDLQAASLLLPSQRKGPRTNEVRWSLNKARTVIGTCAAQSFDAVSRLLVSLLLVLASSES